MHPQSTPAPDSPQLKRCPDCGETKTATAFPRHRLTRDGRNTYCQSCQNERQRRWRLRNPDRAKSHQRGYQERVGGTPQHEYEARNREAQAARRSDWKKRNYLKVREYANRRRLWVIASGETVDLAAVLTEYGLVCHLCGGTIAGKDDLHFDHVVSLSRGGAHTQENIRPAHRLCNLRKNNKQ